MAPDRGIRERLETAERGRQGESRKPEDEERKEDHMGETDSLTKTKWIVEAALELKAEQPVCLDMRELTAFADTFVILTGRSDRQVRSIADAISHMLKSRGETPLGIEGLDDGNWVLIDSNDAIVHIFDPETRTKYDLERLWRDAPRIDLANDLGLEQGLGQGLEQALAQGRNASQSKSDGVTEAATIDDEGESVDAEDPAA
jgi:ribosome-associated protein